MTEREAIDSFLAQKTLALAGLSRSGRGFGHVVLRDLTAKGYEVYPIHPEVTEIKGVRCYSSLSELPKRPGGLVLVVPPRQTERLVEEAVAAGVERVWMQPGAESADAVRFCVESGISAVHGACILMFVEPAAFLHRVHRWIWRILGKLPE